MKDVQVRISHFSSSILLIQSLIGIAWIFSGVLPRNHPVPRGSAVLGFPGRQDMRPRKPLSANRAAAFRQVLDPESGSPLALSLLYSLYSYQFRVRPLHRGSFPIAWRLRFLPLLQEQETSN